MHLVFKTLGNEVTRFLTFKNWLLPMPGPHVLETVGFWGEVEVELDGHTEPRSQRFPRRQPFLQSELLSSQAERSHSRHSVSNSVVLAGDRETSGEQHTETALSRQPPELLLAGSVTTLPAFPSIRGS